MFPMTTSIIDDLGRVTLPSKIRQSMKWEYGDSIAFYNLGNTIVLNMYEKAKEPKCVMCGRTKTEMHIGKFSFCSDCILLVKNELEFTGG